MANPQSEDKGKSKSLANMYFKHIGEVIKEYGTYAQRAQDLFANTQPAMLLSRDYTKNPEKVFSRFAENAAEQSITKAYLLISSLEQAKKHGETANIRGLEKKLKKRVKKFIKNSKKASEQAKKIERKLLREPICSRLQSEISYFEDHYSIQTT